MVSSANKTGFIGFSIPMKIFQLIYNEYVTKENYLDYILTYKFSQDHLEVLFSSIRVIGGFNNNTRVYISIEWQKYGETVRDF